MRNARGTRGATASTGYRTKMRAARPSWDDYFLGIARAVAVRADCTRRQVGAVIVKNNRIVATGYNGAPAREPGCLSAGACPRGKHYRVPGEIDGLNARVCGCGNAWPCPDSVELGSSYDTGPGTCINLHAEQNALLYSSRADVECAVMYCTDDPCGGCWRMIRGSGILKVVWPEGREEWSRHGV